MPRCCLPASLPLKRAWALALPICSSAITRHVLQCTLCSYILPACMLVSLFSSSHFSPVATLSFPSLSSSMSSHLAVLALAACSPPRRVSLVQFPSETCIELELLLPQKHHLPEVYAFPVFSCFGTCSKALMPCGRSTARHSAPEHLQGILPDCYKRLADSPSDSYSSSAEGRARCLRVGADQQKRIVRRWSDCSMGFKVGGRSPQCHDVRRRAQ
jgi:hypothetical protein